MEEFKFEIDDTYIHYIKFGSGSKTILILLGISLCGFEGFGASCAKPYRVFEEEYTCYIIDRRAFINKPITIENLADDLYKLITYLKIEKADIIGLSQGGMIAQVFAVKHPEMVSSLGLCSTAARATSVSIKTMTALDEYLKVFDVYNFNLNFYKAIYSEHFLGKHKKAFDRLAHNGSKEQCTRFRYLCYAIADFDGRPNFNKIKCPVFVIGSSEDNILGVEGSTELAEGLGAKLYICEGASHMVFEEDPNYGALLKSFLDRNLGV